MFKRFRIMLLAPLLIAAFGLTPALVLADCANPATPAEAIQCGTDSAAGAPANSTPASIDSTIASIINLISVAVGIAAVIMIIVGGFRYVTSAGNQELVKSAKNTIVYAIVGLVIVALAQAIVAFVLNKATSGGSGATPTSGTCNFVPGSQGVYVDSNTGQVCKP